MAFTYLLIILTLMLRASNLLVDRGRVSALDASDKDPALKVLSESNANLVRQCSLNFGLNNVPQCYTSCQSPTELVITALLLGCPFNASKLSSYFIKYSSKPAHNTLHCFLQMYLFGRTRKESTLESSIYSIDGPEGVEFAKSLPEYATSQLQTIDILEKVTMTSDLKRKLKCLRRLNMVNLEEAEIDNMSGELIIEGDVFIGRDVKSRQTTKEARYAGLRTILSALATRLDCKVVRINAGFERRLSDIENILATIVTSESHRPIPFQAEFRNMLRVIFQNESEFLDMCIDLYGRETVNKFTRLTTTTSTKMSLGTSVIQETAKELVRNRVAINNVSEMKKLLHDDGSEESSFINSFKTTEATEVVVSHIGEAVLDALSSGDIKPRITRHSSESLSEIFPKLAEAQKEKCKGLVPKPDKSVSSIAWFKTDPALIEKQEEDVTIQALGENDASRFPSEREFIIPFEMTLEQAVSIVKILVSKIPFYRDGKTDLFIHNYKLMGNSDSQTRFFTDVINSISASRKQARPVLSYLPVNLFDPKLGIEFMSKALSEIPELLSLGKKNIMQLIVSQFRVLQSQAPKEKRVLRAKYESSSLQDRASIGIDVWEAQRKMKGKDFKVASSFVPIDLGNDAFERAVSQMIQEDAKSYQHPCYSEKVEDIKSEIREQFRKTTTQESGMGLNQFVDSYSKFSTSQVGQATSFLHRMALQVGADMGRDRRKGEFNFSEISDGVYMCVFGGKVTSGSDNSDVRVLLFTDDSSKILESTKFCCNNLLETVLVRGFTPVKFFHTKLLIIPRFVINNYVTMHFNIKQCSDMYRSLCPKYLKEDGSKGIRSPVAAEYASYDDIDQVLFLLANRFTLNTALIQSYSRYIGMHKSSSTTGLKAFGLDKLDCPVRHQADMFLLKRFVNFDNQPGMSELHNKVLQIFTEETGKLMKSQNKQYDVPSIMFSHFKQLPDPSLGTREFYNLLSSKTNKSNLGSSLSALPQEFYYMTIFSRSVENTGNDDRSVIKDGLKLEHIVRRKRYEGSSSEARFQTLRAFRKNGGANDPQYKALLAEHYEAEKVESFNLDYNHLERGIDIGLDMNMYYKLNKDEDFNMYDTGLTKSGLMSDALCLINDLIKSPKKATCAFSAVALAAGNQITNSVLCDAHGALTVQSCMDENKKNARSISTHATYKSTVMKIHQQPLPLKSIGSDHQSVKNYLVTNMGRRQKRCVSVIEMLLNMQLGPQAMKSYRDATEGSVGETKSRSTPYIDLKNSCFKELVKRHGKSDVKAKVQEAIVETQKCINPELMLKIELTRIYEDYKNSEIFEETPIIDAKAMFNALRAELGDWEDDRAETLESLNDQSAHMHNEFCSEFIDYNEFCEKFCENERQTDENYSKTAAELSVLPQMKRKFLNGKIITLRNSDLDSNSKEKILKSYKKSVSYLKDHEQIYTSIKRRTDAEKFQRVTELTSLKCKEFIDDGGAKIPDTDSKILFEVLHVLGYYEKMSRKYKTSRSTKQFEAEVSSTQDLLAQAKSVLEGVSELDDLSKEEISLCNAAVFAMCTASVYMKAQWFKKPQLIGVRPISIFDNDTATKVAAVENIFDQKSYLDVRNTTTESNKFARFTGVINSVYGFLKDEGSEDKHVSVINCAADCKGWCNEKNMAEMSINLAGFTDVCEQTTQFCKVACLQNFVKKLEIPKTQILGWLNLNKNPKRTAVVPDSLVDVKNKFLIDLIPILVITSGMLQGVYNKTSTESQGAADSLKVESFKSVITRLSRFDERLKRFKFKSKVLFGSDDLFDSMAHSFPKMSSLVTFDTKVMKDADREMANAERRVKEVESALQAQELFGSSEEGLSKRSSEELVQLKDSLARAREDALEKRLNIGFSTSSTHGMKFLMRKPDESFAIIPPEEASSGTTGEGGGAEPTSVDTKCFPLTDAELSNFINNLYLAIQEKTLNLCNCNLSSKTAVTNLILEYNSIFCSAEGQNNCRIKFLIAANNMFSTSDVTAAAEECINKLRTLSENYCPEHLYWNTVFSQEFLFNKLYSTGPKGKNYFNKIFGSPMENSHDAHYVLGVFPRLSQCEVTTEGGSYISHLCEKSKDTLVSETYEMMFLGSETFEEVTGEVNESETMIMKKVKTIFQSSKSYDKFVLKLNKAGITPELLDQMIVKKPAIGLIRSETVMDEMFSICSTFFGSGATKAFRVDTSEGDLRMVNASKSGAIFVSDDSKREKLTFRELLRGYWSRYKEFKKREGKKISPKVFRVNSETCAALDRVRDFLNKDVFRVNMTLDALENVRYCKATVRADQLVGEIPTGEYYMKMWWGLSYGNTYTENAYHRTREILTKSCPHLRDSYGEFIRASGFDATLPSENPIDMDDDKRELELGSIKEMRKYTRYVAEKVRYKSTNSKIFARFGTPSTLDNYLKRIIETTKHHNCRVTFISSNNMVIDLVEKTFSLAGKVRDACGVLWNIFSVNPGSLSQDNLRRWCRCIHCGSESLEELIKSISLPTGLSDFKGVNAFEKATLLHVLEAYNMVTDINRVMCYSLLCSDFSKRGTILVTKGSSQNPRGSDFSCVNLAPTGCVRADIYKNEVGKRTAKFFHSPNISQSDLTVGFKACLSYYFGTDKDTRLSALMKKMYEAATITQTPMLSNFVSQVHLVGDLVYLTTQLGQRPEDTKMSFYSEQTPDELVDSFKNLVLSKFSLIKIRSEIHLTCSLPRGHYLKEFCTGGIEGQAGREGGDLHLRIFNAEPASIDRDSVVDLKSVIQEFFEDASGVGINAVFPTGLEGLTDTEIIKTIRESSVTNLLESSGGPLGNITLGNLCVENHLSDRNSLERSKKESCLMNPCKLIGHLVNCKFFNSLVHNKLRAQEPTLEDVLPDYEPEQLDRPDEIIDTQEERRNQLLTAFENLGTEASGARMREAFARISAPTVTAAEIVETKDYGAIGFGGRNYNLMLQGRPIVETSFLESLKASALRSLRAGLKSLLLPVPKKEVSELGSGASALKTIMLSPKFKEKDTLAIPLNELEDVYARYYYLLHMITKSEPLSTKSSEVVLMLCDEGYLLSPQETTRTKLKLLMPPKMDKPELYGDCDEEAFLEVPAIFRETPDLMKKTLTVWSNYRLRSGVPEFVDSLVMALIASANSEDFKDFDTKETRKTRREAVARRLACSLMKHELVSLACSEAKKKDTTAIFSQLSSADLSEAKKAFYMFSEPDFRLPDLTKTRTENESVFEKSSISQFEKTLDLINCVVNGDFGYELQVILSKLSVLITLSKTSAYPKCGETPSMLLDPLEWEMFKDRITAEFKDSSEFTKVCNVGNVNKLFMKDLTDPIIPGPSPIFVENLSALGRKAHVQDTVQSESLSYGRQQSIKYFFASNNKPSLLQIFFLEQMKLCAVAASRASESFESRICVGSSIFAQMCGLIDADRAGINHALYLVDNVLGMKNPVFRKMAKSAFDSDAILIKTGSDNLKTRSSEYYLDLDGNATNTLFFFESKNHILKPGLCYGYETNPSKLRLLRSLIKFKVSWQRCFESKTLLLQAPIDLLTTISSLFTGLSLCMDLNDGTLRNTRNKVLKGTQSGLAHKTFIKCYSGIQMNTAPDIDSIPLTIFGARARMAEYFPDIREGLFGPYNSHIVVRCDEAVKRNPILELPCVFTPTDLSSFAKGTKLKVSRGMFPSLKDYLQSEEVSTLNQRVSSAIIPMSQMPEEFAGMLESSEKELESVKEFTNPLRPEVIVANIKREMNIRENDSDNKLNEPMSLLKIVEFAARMGFLKNPSRLSSHELVILNCSLIKLYECDVDQGEIDRFEYLQEDEKARRMIKNRSSEVPLARVVMSDYYSNSRQIKNMDKQTRKKILEYFTSRESSLIYNAFKYVAAPTASEIAVSEVGVKSIASMSEASSRNPAETLFRSNVFESIVSYCGFSKGPDDSMLRKPFILTALAIYGDETKEKKLCLAHALCQKNPDSPAPSTFEEARTKLSAISSRISTIELSGEDQTLVSQKYSEVNRLNNVWACIRFSTMMRKAADHNFPMIEMFPTGVSFSSPDPLPMEVLNDLFKDVLVTLDDDDEEVELDISTPIPNIFKPESVVEPKKKLIWRRSQTSAPAPFDILTRAVPQDSASSSAEPSRPQSSHTTTFLPRSSAPQRQPVASQVSQGDNLDQDMPPLEAVPESRGAPYRPPRQRHSRQIDPQQIISLREGIRPRAPSPDAEGSASGIEESSATASSAIGAQAASTVRSSRTIWADMVDDSESAESQ